jgi:hypothetical protein
MRERSSIQDALSNLIGKSAWGPTRDVGSIFFLQLGQPQTIPGLRGSYGEWHFLIDCCHWRFETSDKLVVGSEDDQQFIDATFVRLDLGRVEGAEVLIPSHDLNLKFSSGARLKTFSTSAEAADQWTQWSLYGPEDYVWVVDGGGNIKCVAKDEPVR